MKKNKSMSKILIGFIIIIAFVLCILTVFTFMQDAHDFRFTYKGKTTLYKVDELDFDKVHFYTETDINGQIHKIEEGYYLDLETDFLRKHYIWNFAKIVYVLQDGMKVEFDSNEYYVNKTEQQAGFIYMSDMFKKEKDGSITLYHRCYDDVYNESLGAYSIKLNHLLKYKNVVEMIVYTPVYK